MKQTHDLKESKTLHIFDYDEVLPSLAEAPCEYAVCLIVCKEEISDGFFLSLVESVINLGTKYIVLRGQNSESIHDEIDIYIENNNRKDVITTYHENDETDEDVANFAVNAIGTGKSSNILIVSDEESDSLVNELIKL